MLSGRTAFFPRSRSLSCNERSTDYTDSHRKGRERKDEPRNTRESKDLAAFLFSVCSVGIRRSLLFLDMPPYVSLSPERSISTKVVAFNPSITAPSKALAEIVQYRPERRTPCQEQHHQTKGRRLFAHYPISSVWRPQPTWRETRRRKKRIIPGLHPAVMQG